MTIELLIFLVLTTIVVRLWLKVVLRMNWWHKIFPEEELYQGIDEIKQQNQGDSKRQKEIADLKRQGYTDELIAVILPTINNK